jgi:hypothetical protein
MSLIPTIQQFELGQADFLGHILPGHDHWKVTTQLILRRSDDVGEKTRPLVQFNNGNNIGKPVLKRRMVSLVIHNVGIDPSTTARQDPSGVLGMTFRAKDRRRPPDMATFPAFLDFELVLAAAIPKCLCVPVGYGERSFAVHFPIPSSE